ncbi:MAG: PAS domain S-box protein [Candidatus Coatesbacteria bacterium]|nr:MAG: PAS domain S-box protein [Candidatus Coatesbacteria bacterium]
MNNPPSKILIGWKKIAAYLNCSPSSARRLVDDGLPIYRVGGSVRADADEIDRWIRHDHTRNSPARRETAFDQTIADDLDLNKVISAFTVEREGRRFAVVPLGISAAELEQVVTRLKSAEEKYRGLLEKVPVWIWETDAQGKYKYSNAEVSKVIGYLPEEIIGRALTKLGIVEEDVPLFENSIEALRREGKTIKHLECRIVHRNGTLRRLETYAEATFDADGKFTGIQGVSCDITDRKSR